jgi:two-component system, chemotaxis family, protein-glutamate methylesterase/glutaminase
MVIEDSPVVRLLLQEIIGGDPRLEVAGAYASAEQALEVLHQVAPDVISLDIRLAGMNGFQATQRIMAERPTPIVVVSASVESEDMKVSINALKAGALAIVEKPVGVARADYQLLASQICTQLVIMSEVKVVRQRRPPAPPAAPAGRPPPPVPGGPFRLLGIAASTGGPQALLTLLGALPPNFPLPILIVQHIGHTFLDGFAAWLDENCPLAVAVAGDGEVPAAGRVYLAPADHHLEARAGRLCWTSGAPVSSQRPSGTVLFRSLARELGPRAIGVLLTGMGDDGAAGLLDMRQAGAFTIAEHESTAVVNGMPLAACRLQAPCETLPLQQIAPRLLDLLRGLEGAAAGDGDVQREPHA